MFTLTASRAHGLALSCALAIAGCKGAPSVDDGAVPGPEQTDSTSGNIDPPLTTTGAGESTRGSVEESGSVPESTTTGATGTDEGGGGEAMCDPAAQDCPEGQKCTAYREAPSGCCTDSNKCVPVIGSGQVGDTCYRADDNDDCDVGLYCDVPGGLFEGEGICRLFCDVDATDACPDDGVCIGYNKGSLPICQTPCDPLSPTACYEGEGCYLVGQDEFYCLWSAAPADGGLDGSKCAGVNECVPGYTCVFASTKTVCSTGRCCTLFCDVNESGICTNDGESCVPVFEEGGAPPGLEDVGVCGIPL